MATHERRPIERRAHSTTHLIAFVHDEDGWCSFFGFDREANGDLASAEVLQLYWISADAWVAHMLLMDCAGRE